MSIKTAKSDMIWSYIGYFFNLCTNLILLPFIMKFVEADQLGLWFTFISVGTLVNLLDFGFSPTLIRNITYAWCGAKEIMSQGVSAVLGDEPNFQLFFKVLQACKYISLTVAGAAFVILITAGSTYIHFVAREIPISIYGIAWIFFSIAVFLNIFYNYWIATLRGVGAIKESQITVIISKIIQIIVSLIGLLLGGGILALAVAYLLSGFVLRIISKQFLFKYKNIGERKKEQNVKITIQELKIIISKVWYNAKKTGTVSISAFVITQSTTMICAAFIGLEATASYGLCLQLILVIQGVSQIFFNANIPMMTNTKIIGFIEKSKRELSLAIAIYWSVFIFSLIALVTIGLPLIGLIRSNTPLPVVMVLFMGCYLFLEGNHSLFATYISFSNSVPFVKAAIISALIIVFGSLVVALFTDFGIYGLMVVQAIVQLCYNNWKWPSVVFKNLNMNVFSMMRLGINEGILMLQIILKKSEHSRDN